MKNIPNILSAARIVAFPVLCYFVWNSQEKLFILLLSIALVTDILDGAIARIFGWKSELGARLDSAADVLMYISGIAGLIHFKNEFVMEHETIFMSVLIWWIVPYLACLIRFRRLPHLHLYSTKISGYLLAIFMFTIFNFGYNAIYFYVAMGFSLLAFVEELIVVLVIKQMRSNVKSIFHVLKEERKRKN